MKGERY